MIRIGKFLFKYRNYIAPLLFLLMGLDMNPIVRSPQGRTILVVAGFIIAFAGQALRALTVGLRYIKRGGLNKQVYADTLVTEGVFAHCRNPLYVGNILLVSGVALVANSLLFLLFGIPAVLFAFACIVATEEQYLRNKFGAQFDDYCRRVNRFVPRLTGLGQTLENIEFNWRRVVVKEYQTIYAWLAGVVLLLWEDDWIARRHAGLPLRPGIWFGLLAGLTTAFFLAWALKKSRVIVAT